MPEDTKGFDSRIRVIGDRPDQGGLWRVDANEFSDAYGYAPDGRLLDDAVFPKYEIASLQCVLYSSMSWYSRALICPDFSTSKTGKIGSRLDQGLAMVACAHILYGHWQKHDLWLC